MISCIIPTYNNLELFKRALMSILKQEDIEKEIIVVDDSTNSEIENYCYSREKEILYFHNKPPLGAVKNWNYGLSLAKGEYVLLIHHDEELKYTNCLRKIEETFNMGYDVVISNIEVHKPNSIKRGLCHAYLKKLFIKLPQLLFFRNFIGPCACVTFRREKMERFDENLKWTVDKEWYYRMLYKKRCRFISDNWIISNHGHAGQITSTLNINEQSELDNACLRSKYAKNRGIKLCLRLNSITRHLQQFGLPMLKKRKT